MLIEQICNRYSKGDFPEKALSFGFSRVGLLLISKIHKDISTYQNDKNNLIDS